MTFTFRQIIEDEAFLSIEADSLEEALEKAKTDEVLSGNFEPGGEGFYPTSLALLCCDDDDELVEDPIYLDLSTGEPTEEGEEVLKDIRESQK